MHSRGRWIAGGVVVAVLGGGASAWGLTRASGHSYRSAPVVRDSVVQTIAATGTIVPVRSADESFQVAGTVASVAVKAGQHIRAGQVLARLDASSLRDEVQSAQAQVSAARSRLTADESGQSGSSAPQGASLEGYHPTVELTPPASQSAPSQGGGLAQQQQAVRSAQRRTDQDLAVARRALADAQSACDTSTSATPPASDSPEPSPSPTPTADSTSCTNASAILLAAQQQVDRDESALAAAEAALSQQLATLAKDASKRNASSGATKPKPSAGASAPASAAQIALDQASIDQALAQLATAKADLAQAVLRSTISGRVAAVTLAKGDRVSMASSDGSVDLVGSRQEQATISLSATQIRQVRVGMPAEVVPDGASSVLRGRVVAVDAAGTVSQSGSTSYPVTIALPASTRIVAGAAAAVNLVVTDVSDVLTVPTSAVHHDGSRTYVELLQNGKEVRVTITIGTVGPARTQVVSGLNAGQLVVLADLNQAVPATSTNLGGGGLFGRGGKGRIAREFIAPGGGSLTVVGPPG